MSKHHPYPDEPSQSQVSLQTHEYKAPYDELIDESDSPFTPTSRHRIYAVQPPMNGHRRGPSYPLNKSFSSSKQSDDAWEHESTSPGSYPPLPPMKEKEVDTRALWQKLLPESLACRLYVLTVLIQTTIDLAIEGELLLQVRSEAEENTEKNFVTQRMAVYLSIFALAHVFQFVMAVDAVYARNTLQFLMLTIFNALFLMYAIFQRGEIQTALSETTKVFNTIPRDVLTTIIPIVIAVAEIAYIGLGWKIYNEFGWQVYKFLGADRRIRKMYANYQIYECLIKFDVFFWIGFSIQFIWLVLNKTDWEYYVTCAALPLSVLLLVEGHLAARHEHKWMMATFMSGCVGAMVYFIYKLIKLLLFRNTDQFVQVWKTMTIFSIIAIVLLMATFVYSVIIMRNFGRGLKNALEKRNAPHHNRFGSQLHHRAASTNPNRMSIN